MSYTWTCSGPTVPSAGLEAVQRSLGERGYRREAGVAEGAMASATSETVTFVNSYGRRHVTASPLWRKRIGATQRRRRHSPALRRREGLTKPQPAARRIAQPDPQAPRSTDKHRHFTSMRYPRQRPSARHGQPCYNGVLTETAVTRASHCPPRRNPLSSSRRLNAAARPSAPQKWAIWHLNSGG